MLQMLRLKYGKGVIIMSGARRGKVIDELDEDTHIVSTSPCGVISVILVGAAGAAASIKLYDHASTASGNVKKMLSTGGTNTPTTVPYCPSRPDAFSNGCVAVVAGTGATAYVSVEPV